MYTLLLYTTIQFLIRIATATHHYHGLHLKFLSQNIWPALSQASWVYILGRWRFSVAIEDCSMNPFEIGLLRILLILSDIIVWETSPTKFRFAATCASVKNRTSQHKTQHDSFATLPRCLFNKIYRLSRHISLRLVLISLQYFNVRR